MGRRGRHRCGRASAGLALVYDGLMFETWLLIVDDTLGVATEGRTTADFPQVDWRTEFEWGSKPETAARAALRHWEKDLDE